MQKGRTMHSCAGRETEKYKNNDSSSYYTIFKFNNNIRNINYLSVKKIYKRCRQRLYDHVDDDTK